MYLFPFSIFYAPHLFPISFFYVPHWVQSVNAFDLEWKTHAVLQLRSLLMHFHIIYSHAYTFSCICGFIQFSYTCISISNLGLLLSARRLYNLYRAVQCFPLVPFKYFWDNCSYSVRRVHTPTHTHTHTNTLREIPSNGQRQATAADASFVLRIAWRHLAATFACNLPLQSRHLNCRHWQVHQPLPRPLHHAAHHVNTSCLSTCFSLDAQSFIELQQQRQQHWQLRHFCHAPTCTYSFSSPPSASFISFSIGCFRFSLCSATKFVQWIY